ncbi:MAG: TAXI family TRAP transporter solute-binding subunit, partial [Rhodospirillales bacterium]|nr:TAXI family TRAP transporter solute-binding subunit [Rhodospirillales bacterium]
MSNIAINRRTAIATGAAFAAASPALAQSRRRITVATGGTGGVFHPYGVGLAKIFSEKMANTQATSQATGGSIDNIKMLHSGEVELGFSTMDSAYDAFQGEGAYKSDGKQDVRVLASLYDSFFHIVASQASGIANVAGMKGKRVSVGSAGSATESIADRVIEAAGLSPVRDVTRDNLGVAESAGALKDGKIAAFFWIGGIPTGAVRDLAAAGQPPIRFVPMTGELAALDRKWPGLYKPFTLAANAYSGQTDAVAGLGVANVLVVSSKAPAALVTAML